MAGDEWEAGVTKFNEVNIRALWKARMFVCGDMTVYIILKEPRDI